VKKAIAETAEAVYRDLSSSDQERVRDIFMRLTRLDEEALTAEERRDTRQRVRLEALTPRGSDPGQAKALVKRLADARLIVTTRNAATGQDEVEVAHEALIRYWPRLREWLDEDRTDLRVLASVHSAVQEWQKDRADESRLTHHGARPTDAERLLVHPRLGLNREEADYLHACRTRQERQEHQQRRYRRRIVQVSVAGAAIALGLAAWAWVLRNQADEDRKAAVTAKTETQITLANELFQPLGLDSGGMSRAELSALTTLASRSEKQMQVRVLFIQKALETPASAQRFANRGAPAIQATVGLNRALGARVAEILRKKLEDREECIATRTAAALALTEVDLADDGLLELTARELVGGLKDGNPIVPVEELARNIVHSTRRLPPDRAATHLDPAAKLLVEALAKEQDSSARAALARGLVEVCKALPSDRAATYLLRSFAQYPQLQSGFIPAISEVAGRCSLPDLIRSLEHPVCYGQARQVFLRRVEQLAERQFQTRWEMVAWLIKNHPEIDLSRPPQEVD
jgi:hypothetical protein